MESLEEIFFKAGQIVAAADQQRYVAEACGRDEALRQQVEQMLRDAEGAEEFFGAQGTVLVSPSTPLTEGPGSVIGHYKLLQKIGEGGMGVVYMAEQREPITRKVALKIVKLGMDTKQVIGRFEAERQALAMMDHPNIAKVLDAGATDTGRPFFVMELVRGIKITDYCDEYHLSTDERLDLFIQICGAVQHAHQKGIIHRDLKPSNILVADHDGVPVPKIIDFGIAKATTGQPLTDKTLFTAFEQFMGTPAYMSPEQAKLSGLNIDTRTDVYSLGVLLYELLTGQTPFDAKQLLKAGLDEMRQIIREQEAPKPSTRLSTMQGGDLTTTAKHRDTEPPKLIHQVRGDLDWIVMKCLDKDRTRRYETANGLAMDIQRHLTNEPVVARPPSRLYEFQKTVRRHKVGFAVTGAIMAVLTFGLGISLWALNRESQARGRAVVAEIKATSEAAQRREEAQRLESLVGSMVSAMSVDVSADSALFTAVLKWTGESLSGLTNEAAFKTNSDVQYLLGLMHHYGVRMPLDDAEAQKWLLRSAEQHNMWAEFWLANRYFRGSGVPKDHGEAAKWMRKAAEDGHHGAQAALVRIYRSGEGVPKDEAEALKWLRIADKNDPLILNWLARDMATSPFPGVRDGSNAVAYADKAVALTGRRDADYLETLAAAYAETGQFSNAVTVEKEAIRLQSIRSRLDGFNARLGLYKSNVAYRKSDEAVNAGSEIRVQTNCAFWNGVAWRFAKGSGVPKDLAAAASWFRKSAEAGDFNAGATAAWILATSIEPKARDGIAAVELAETAVAATSRKSAAHLDILAAAYAENEEFEKAINTEMEAMALPATEVAKADYRSHLKLYESKAPYHDAAGFVPNLWAKDM